MRESFAFNIDRQESGIPLSASQDGAVDATKSKIKMFADDLSRMLRGEATKHRWQLVDKAGQPIAAMDQVSGRRASAALSQNKLKQKHSHVPPLARQQQSQNDKAALIDRLYGGRGSLEAKFWPDA